MALVDWRRRVAQLYADVRANPDPRAAHAHWVSTRDALLREHPESPVPADRRATFRGVPMAAYDPAFRFDVVVDPGVEPVEWAVQTGTDGVVRFRRIGRAGVPAVGELDVWWLLGYGGGMFIPVRDSALQTYGGGRYLIDTVKGADLGGDGDRLVLDMNFAYNPSCAYDPAWACPLAPAGNTVAVPLPVGELSG
jgi:uncharacterized protein (DUF1684 family)